MLGKTDDARDNSKNLNELNKVSSKRQADELVFLADSRFYNSDDQK
jgi:hypothetical protein